MLLMNSQIYEGSNFGILGKSGRRIPLAMAHSLGVDRCLSCLSCTFGDQMNP